jgi:hypothetical protein
VHLDSRSTGTSGCSAATFRRVEDRVLLTAKRPSDCEASPQPCGLSRRGPTSSITSSSSPLQHNTNNSIPPSSPSSQKPPLGCHHTYIMQHRNPAPLPSMAPQAGDKSYIFPLGQSAQSHLRSAPMPPSTLRARKAGAEPPHLQSILHVFQRPDRPFVCLRRINDVLNSLLRSANILVWVLRIQTSWQKPLQLRRRRRPARDGPVVVNLHQQVVPCVCPRLSLSHFLVEPSASRAGRVSVAGLAQADPCCCLPARTSAFCAVIVSRLVDKTAGTAFA